MAEVTSTCGQVRIDATRCEKLAKKSCNKYCKRVMRLVPMLARVVALANRRGFSHPALYRRG